MTQPTKLLARQRAAILQHGGLQGRCNGKTGLSLLRYAEARVVAIIDEDSAGRSLRELTGLRLPEDIPIVRSVHDALPFKPEVLSIGVAPSGGRLPDEWWDEIRLAVRSGLCVQNGLHTRLNSDPGIQAALRPGQWVWDMRREPEDLPIGTGAARSLACRRVLFVGTDMNVGKMTAALEFDACARRRGLRSKFIATGQTGMMISGDGVALDGVRVDYAAGAIEQQVMRHGPGHELLFIEGQGSLINPASTATLPLIRGSQPTSLILVHKARMTHLNRFPHVAVPPLREVIALNEAVAKAGGAFGAARVAAVALNTWGLSEAEASLEALAVETETGLPCDDVVRSGASRLLEALLRNAM
ncbi:MAG: DUF1611 domain-containing protein [Verrucomicrobia bacterium]|nr:DUF1611 domain-containing protein [Verrucomicrobiota bacterium]MBI3867027.1 DUF1611 domain-containing protein [Verrucomicrobiota bacterium]